MKAKKTRLALVSVVCSLLLVLATSCSTNDPVVNGTTGATKTRQY